MPRVSEVEEDGGDPILKAVFERQRGIYGGLLNPARDPVAVKGFACQRLQDHQVERPIRYFGHVAHQQEYAAGSC